jgi:DNA-binding transcriptional MerR regulator
MLAQITNQIAAGSAWVPDPRSAQSIGWLCIGLVAIIAGVRSALGLYRDLRNPPQQTTVTNDPLTVQKAIEYARTEECQARHAEDAKKIEELHTQLSTLQRERVEDARAAALSRKGMYTQIDEVRKELSAKIDTMPQLIITQLVNSKNLFKDIFSS